MRLDGKARGSAWDRIAGVYRTGDGRHVRLHTNFPHHRDGMLKLFACAYEREAVEAALLEWEAESFETAAAEAGLVATMLRSPAEWAVHPQGRAVAALPEGGLSFLLFPVQRPELFDAVVTDETGRVQEIQVKRPDAVSSWIWGAFRCGDRSCAICTCCGRHASGRTSTSGRSSTPGLRRAGGRLACARGSRTSTSGRSAGIGRR